MSVDLGKTLLIANPAAQRGNGAKAAAIASDLLASWLGEESFHLAMTRQPGHATEIAASPEAAAEAVAATQASMALPGNRADTRRVGLYDTVIALGGDGVVHEVVNGLMRLAPSDRPRFGLIPVGSGNDYAKTLGMSEVVPDAIVQFLEADEVAADVGCCNGEYFAETLSFGLDAAIALDTVARRERTGEQGTVLYLKSGIDQLLHHLDAYAFEAVIDDGAGANESQVDSGAKAEEPLNPAVLRATRQIRDDDAGLNRNPRALKGSMHMFAVQVGPTYGGGFRICPDARIDDGLLDICYAEAPMSVVEATFKFLSAKDAHHTRFKNIHFERAHTIDLSFDRRPPCQIDGEPHVADSYRISLVPSALRVLKG